MLFNPPPSDKNAYTHRNPGAPENYCWLLAGEIRSRAHRLGLITNQQAISAAPQPIPDDAAGTFLESLSLALAEPFVESEGLYSPAKLDQQRLSDLLYASPRAQGRLASIVEYTPSKWLLQQEIIALGEWPGQEDEKESRNPRKPYFAPTQPSKTTAPVADMPEDVAAESAVESAAVPQGMPHLATNVDTPPPKPQSDVYQVAARLGLSGMCFSGGGIRSATFNLGVLQGLAARGKLGCFDYLSTVSGGGYIHQFLASWIDCEGLAKVQEQLAPLPAAPHRSLWPDPLRWLRRYSNYLTPQKGLFSADTWVVAAIWLRNTMLNQIVLISTLLLLLLLPHARVSPSHGIAQFVLSVQGEIAAAAIVFLCGLCAAYSVCKGIVAPDLDSSTAAGVATERRSMRQHTVLLCVLLPISLASFAVSPYLYRSAFWTPSSLAHAASSPTYDPGPDSTQRIIRGNRHLAPIPSAAPATSNCCCGTKISTTAAPASATAVPSGMDNLRAWRSQYSFSWWTDDKGSVSLVFGALLLGICMFAGALWTTIAEFQRGLATTRTLFGIIVVVAAAFGYLFIHLVRIATFYSTFFLPPMLVTRCAIVLIPPAVLCLFLVCVNLSIGLIGHLMEDASREWLARLRAWSFIATFGWIAFTGASLLGHWIVTVLFGLAYIKHAVIWGWIGTTIASVLAGKSPRTASVEKTDGKASSPFSALNILTVIGPPVFITGLILLLSYVVEQAIIVLQAESWATSHAFIPYLLLFGALATIALFFGWRVDINDFSLHAFYRDRIARCYAGASNPDRRPDPFTGFSASDTRLRMVDLLPDSFYSLDQIDLWKPPLKGSAEEAVLTKLQNARDAAKEAVAAADMAMGSDPEDENEAKQKVVEASRAVEVAERERELCYRGSPYYNRRYQGPFPIFSTSINLSFGEDLAYQERKAAAFAFTPLFSGYDIGWTEGKNRRIQFNGFTPTCDFAYPDGGPHMSTAVAASGAAVSPNSGFHTSPAMAFLMTMFNARLGWWIRNPRHRDFLYSQFVHKYSLLRKYIDENPASPRFPLSYLLAELFGLVNDESAYVCLTDGGHFENMGLYELVRRRCMKILISDAEEDPDFVFEGIGMAIRKCRIDFGAEINLDLDALKRNKNCDSKVHFVTGTIQYPEIDEPGSILYIKSTLSAGLPADLANYRKQDLDFPHDTTLNQWFTESRFESYRRLGYFSIQPNATTAASAKTTENSVEIDQWLDSLDCRA
jgi:hypothetical protein